MSLMLWLGWVAIVVIAAWIIIAISDTKKPPPAI